MLFQRAFYTQIILFGKTVTIETKFKQTWTALTRVFFFLWWDFQAKLISWTGCTDIITCTMLSKKNRFLFFGEQERNKVRRDITFIHDHAKICLNHTDDHFSERLQLTFRKIVVNVCMSRNNHYISYHKNIIMNLYILKIVLCMTDKGSKYRFLPLKSRSYAQDQL